MNTGATLFAQVMAYLPLHEFRLCVQRYQGNYKIKNFTCTDQFLCMAFAQLTYRESLRDIEICLRTQQNKLYHMGIRGKVSRNTLANANATRDWRIYADFAQVLIKIARDLYIDEEFGVELENTVYALDASTIDLCLASFPWAHFRKYKGAIKLHTLLDLRGNIPTFIRISSGKMQDVLVLDELLIEAGAFYIMDRGYLDFTRLYHITQCLGFFITRSKSNTKLRRLYSRPVDKSTGLRCDQTVTLTGNQTKKNYPDKLRRIKFFDETINKSLVFLTNNFELPALTIAQLYRCRWQVELFFKWIKQHLRIKNFFGRSDNAVRSQIWIAVSTYVLVAIIKKTLKLDHSLYTILQILSVTVFEKIPILQAFSEPQLQKLNMQPPNQLILFD